MIEQRKSKRYEIRLPVEVIRSGSRRVNINGETRNISSGGVLFHADQVPGLGDSVEYIVTLPSPVKGGLVRLRCMGKVVRLEPINNSQPPGVTRGIAVTLERYEFLRSATNHSHSLATGRQLLVGQQT